MDKRLLRLLRDVRLAFAVTIALGVIGGVLLVAQAALLSRTITRVFLDGQPLAAVTPFLLALVGVAVLRGLATWIGQISAHHTAAWIKQHLRERLFAHLLALGPAYTQGERSGELVNTALEGIEALDAYFSKYLPQVAISALVPLTFLLIIFPLDPLSGVVLLVTAPLIPLFMILIGRLAEHLTQQQWQTLSRMSAHFLDVLQGLTTLKLFGRSRAQIAVIADISDRFRDRTLRVLRVAFLSALALELLSTISTALVAVEIGLRLLYGVLEFEQALFILVLAPEYYLPLRALGTQFHAGMAGVTAAQRIFAVLETPLPQAVEPAAGGGEGGVPARMHLRFDDVRYAYDDGARVALDGVSFTVEPGQQVALVGPSGSGKSTVAALLLRFIAAQSGTITVDGVSLGALDADAWRRQVAWVPQNPYLFNTSALENIRLARPTAAPDEVMWAARQAHAHEFIQTLPDGYDTVVGERGARLSGGQAQRIALARAFLKDAPLLLLDEATANLDADTEALLNTAMRRLMANRTALVIAHRLSTVTAADLIVVLKDGRIAECGSHAELLAGDGLYRRLVTAYGGAG